jgi:hypothetical protein
VIRKRTSFSIFFTSESPSDLALLRRNARMVPIFTKGEAIAIIPIGFGRVIVGLLRSRNDQQQVKPWSIGVQHHGQRQKPPQSSTVNP